MITVPPFAAAQAAAGGTGLRDSFYDRDRGTDSADYGG